MEKILIQYVSDIHLEFVKPKKNFFENYIKPCAPYLAVVGDLGYPHLSHWELFLAQASKTFIKVFFVPGNHEYYSKFKTMSQIEQFMKTSCLKWPNVFYLNNDLHQLNCNTLILGTTLWSDISMNRLIDDHINDFNKIQIEPSQTLTRKEYQNLHLESIKWLKSTLQLYPTQNIIVLTHHLPSFQMIAPKYQNDYNNINCAFASNLDYIMEEHSNIHFWLCGHTHTIMKAQINHCTCLTNPHGYPGENKPNLEAWIEFY